VGLDFTCAALFLRSKLENSEALLDVAYRRCNFHRMMLIEALGWCMVPPPDDASRSKRVKFLNPPLPDKGMCREPRCDKGKRRTDPVVEESLCDKGKGCADPGTEEEELPSSGGEADWSHLINFNIFNSSCLCHSCIPVKYYRCSDSHKWLDMVASC
jgi:hypothetical protein